MRLKIRSYLSMFVLIVGTIAIIWAFFKTPNYQNVRLSESTYTTLAFTSLLFAFSFFTTINAKVHAIFKSNHPIISIVSIILYLYLCMAIQDIKSTGLLSTTEVQTTLFSLVTSVVYSAWIFVDWLDPLFFIIPKITNTKPKE